MTDPVAPPERVQVVDILRGAAVFGILLVNMDSFGWPIFLEGLRVWEGLPDRLADWLIRFLAQGKFYPLFSFLFGLGMAMQMARVEARGARFGSLYARRLLVLLLIGAAHALLLWAGDILVAYALLGFLLIVFRNRSPKTLIAWAVVSMAVAVGLNALFIGRNGVGGGDQFLEVMVAQATRAYAHGTFADIFWQRIFDLAIIYALAPLMVPHVFVMFLLGLYSGRRGLFQDAPSTQACARAAMPWAVGIGLAGNLIFVVVGGDVGRPGSALTGIAASTALLIGGPALTVAYMAAIVLLVQREAWLRRLIPLAAVGRMALSNYLLQSLICTTVFYSYGLGLFGTVGPARGVILTVAIYAVQIPLSVWWLQRFRFGPVEWLWRSLTYGRLQPMRVRAG